MLDFFTLLTQKHISGLQKKHKGHKQYDLVVVSCCKYYDASFFSFPRILVLKHTSKT